MKSTGMFLRYALCRALRLVLLILAAFILVGAATTAESQEPTPDQARRLLQSRPDLAAQLRQRLSASGLTPDQVSARLRAAGYPEDLLDAYLVGADTSKAARPTATVLEAIRLLGIGSPADLEDLAADTGTAANRGPADDVRTVGPVLKLFGAEVFQRASSQFQPTLSGPVDPSYRLGPGDVLVLILTGDVELAHTLEVTREGFVVIPQVGQLYVANLRVAQLEDLLYDRLGRVYSGVRRGSPATTRFQVTVARLRTSQIYVVGDVRRPGSYQISAAGTVLTALYAAAGPAENGNFRRIEIRRGSTLVDSLDLYDYLLRGNSAHDIRLETGDVVFTPVKGARVSISGRVVRPAIYEIKPAETLRDLIQFAGGFEADALRRRVQINRILPPVARVQDGKDRVVIELAPDQFADGGGPAFTLEPGDAVTVFEVAPKRRGFVTMAGNVWVTGQLGYSSGMSLSDALRLAGGPKPDFYQGQILVSRLQTDSTRIQLRSAFADNSGTLVRDLPLADEDEIRVFARSDFRPARYVSLTGAVRSPGRLPFLEGMTLRDAILQVNGLTEDADLREVEIARLPLDRSHGEVATTIRVPLDSTYLFERGSDGSYLGPPGLAAMAKGATETPLEPYDNVLILRQPGWELQRTVSIAGQVKFPGRYSLRTTTDRITDLLRRAGGLTPTAYAIGGVFSRVTDQKGNIGIDLAKVLEDSTFRDNLILFDEDSLFIPEYNPVVMVGGAVNAPIAVAYVPGRNIDHYVAAAGGLSRMADAGRVYVIQPNGKVQSIQRRFFVLPDGKPTPLAGARVVVPEKAEKPNENALAVAATLASIITSLATVLIVAFRN